MGIADENATEEDVSDALESLQEAIRGLVEKDPDPTPTLPDKSGLESALSGVDSYLDSDRYTDESLDNLKDAIDHANQVIADENATEEDISDAIKDLNAAIEGLTDKPNKPETDPEPSVDTTVLENIIDRFLDVLQSGNYTDESINRVWSIIARIPENPTQSEVNYYAGRICEAILALENVTDYYIPSEPLNGWKHYASGTFYYQDGKRTRGWAEIDGKTYYFNQQGFMQTGWLELEDDGWYYLNEDGVMQTGWLKLGNTWYYLDPVNGRMYDNGLADIDGETYYFYDWGGMANSWWYETEDGDWYFFGGSGAMKTAQWLEWKGDWYYLTASGKMAVNTTTPDGYYVNANGVWNG